MPLIHEFLLVSKSYIKPSNYGNIERNNGKLILETPGIIDYIEFPDNLILYLSDFILWVPSINIAKRNKKSQDCPIMA